MKPRKEGPGKDRNQRTRERQETEDQRKTGARGPEKDKNQRTRGRQEPEDQRNT